MQFLAVPGDPIELVSTIPSAGLVSTPSFPAENVITMSLLFQANWSVCWESVVYAPATGAPQEFEWTRAPSA